MTIDELYEWLIAEIERERRHLIAISGPTGTRSGQASALGLARNTVRQEVLEKLDMVVAVTK